MIFGNIPKTIRKTILIFDWIRAYDSYANYAECVFFNFFPFLTRRKSWEATKVSGYPPLK